MGCDSAFLFDLFLGGIRIELAVILQINLFRRFFKPLCLVILVPSALFIYLSIWVSERKFMEDLVVNRNGVSATAGTPFLFSRGAQWNPIGSHSVVPLMPVHSVIQGGIDHVKDVRAVCIGQAI